MTRTGMPASVRTRIVRNRRAGKGTRGSIAREVAGSSVVTEIPTRTSPLAAIGARMSMSRSINVPLVVIATGWLKAASTAKICRMICRCFSIG